MRIRKNGWVGFLLGAFLLTMTVGCTPEQTEELEDKAAEAESDIAKGAADLGDAISDKAGELGDQAQDAASKAGEQIGDQAEKLKDNAADMAKNLSEKAQAWMGPLKTSMQDLSKYKDKPEELKTKVDELLASLKEGMGNLELPDAMKGGLETLQTKLQQLKDYLAKEAKPEEIEKQLQGIADSAKSFFQG